MIRDFQFEDEFRKLINSRPVGQLEQVMGSDEYFEEVLLWSRIDQIDFLGEMSVAGQNQALIRAATWNLDVILEYARLLRRPRFDYWCMATLATEEDFEAGDVLQPNFWLANPSLGVFDYLLTYPPESDFAKFVGECLEHDPHYQLNENYSEFPPGAERVYIQRADMTGTPDRAGPPRKA